VLSHPSCGHRWRSSQNAAAENTQAGEGALQAALRRLPRRCGAPGAKPRSTEADVVRERPRCFVGWKQDWDCPWRIYGVTSYAVVQRINEIGIRVALGTQRSDVLRWVVYQGIKLASAGVLIGLLASLGLWLMASLLFGVRTSR